MKIPILLSTLALTSVSSLSTNAELDHLFLRDTHTTSHQLRHLGHQFKLNMLRALKVSTPVQDRCQFKNKLKHIKNERQLRDLLESCIKVHQQILSEGKVKDNLALQSDIIYIKDSIAKVGKKRFGHEVKSLVKSNLRLDNSNDKDTTISKVCELEQRIKEVKVRETFDQILKDCGEAYNVLLKKDPSKVSELNKEFTEIQVKIQKAQEVLAQNTPDEQKKDESKPNSKPNKGDDKVSQNKEGDNNDKEDSKKISNKESDEGTKEDEPSSKNNGSSSSVKDKKLDEDKDDLNEQDKNKDKSKDQKNKEDPSEVKAKDGDKSKDQDDKEKEPSKANDKDSESDDVKTGKKENKETQGKSRTLNHVKKNTDVINSKVTSSKNEKENEKNSSKDDDNDKASSKDDSFDADENKELDFQDNSSMEDVMTGTRSAKKANKETKPKLTKKKENKVKKNKNQDNDDDNDDNDNDKDSKEKSSKLTSDKPSSLSSYLGNFQLEMENTFKNINDRITEDLFNIQSELKQVKDKVLNIKKWKKSKNTIVKTYDLGNKAKGVVIMMVKKLM